MDRETEMEALRYMRNGWGGQKEEGRENRRGGQGVLWGDDRMETPPLPACGTRERGAGIRRSPSVRPSVRPSLRPSLSPSLSLPPSLPPSLPLSLSLSVTLSLVPLPPPAFLIRISLSLSCPCAHTCLSAPPTSPSPLRAPCAPESRPFSRRCLGGRLRAGQRGGGACAAPGGQLRALRAGRDEAVPRRQRPQPRHPLPRGPSLCPLPPPPLSLSPLSPSPRLSLCHGNFMARAACQCTARASVAGCGA